jgi:hypothetical protein
MKIHIAAVTIEAHRDMGATSIHILCMEGLMDVAQEVDKKHESLALLDSIEVKIIDPRGLSVGRGHC